jgi:hypothetical protein
MIDSNLFLTLLGTLLAIFGIFYTFYFDKSIIKIKSVVPGMNGVREENKEWKHTVRSIIVEVHNKGRKDAKNCDGLVIFKKMDSLTLYSNERAKKFDILAGEKKHLEASWSFSGTDIVEFDKGTFLDKAPPILVVIYCGEKRIRKTLKEKDIEKFLMKIEEQEHKFN